MKNNLDRYDRDTPYWNEYYKSIASEELTPSKFAIDMAKHMEKGKHLLDLGCGNGRDSLFFLHKGMNVTGIDASDFSIKICVLSAVILFPASYCLRRSSIIATQGSSSMQSAVSSRQRFFGM